MYKASRKGMNIEPALNPPWVYDKHKDIELNRYTITFTVDCEDERDEKGMKYEISKLLQINEDRNEEIISFKLERK